MKTGKHSVVIGNVPHGSEIGEGSVVIGATDSAGNAIVNTPGAFGYGAMAGPGSIAVGAFAGAGSGAGELSFPEQIREELLALVALAAQQRDMEALDALKDISDELSKQSPQPGAIHKAWSGVQALATVDGAHSLLSKAAVALFSFLQSSG